jgi:hypothetical protein
VKGATASSIIRELRLVSNSHLGNPALATWPILAPAKGVAPPVSVPAFHAIGYLALPSRFAISDILEYNICDEQQTRRCRSKGIRRHPGWRCPGISKGNEGNE